MLKRLWMRVWRLRWWQKGLIAVIGVLGAAGGSFAALTFYSQSQSNSTRYIRRWFDDTTNRSALMTFREPCPGAPFVLPSDGFIGLLWNDPSAPYNIFRRHTGLDIFGDGTPGDVPVYAVYEGYLTRLPEWKSSVIIRHDDPLHPGRTIWTYYTHMASREGDMSFIDAAFPPGTSEQWVDQGTLLGYQGQFSGSVIPTGLHVHISIVKSEPDGSFKNEARTANTLDPSPYFGMPLNSDDRPDRPIRCATSGQSAF